MHPACAAPSSPAHCEMGASPICSSGPSTGLGLSAVECSVSLSLLRSLPVAGSHRSQKKHKDQGEPVSSVRNGSTKVFMHKDFYTAWDKPQLTSQPLLCDVEATAASSQLLAEWQSSSPHRGAWPTPPASHNNA